MFKKKKIIFIILIFLLLILNGRAVKYSKEELLKLIPHVLVGEQIEVFDIVAENNQLLNIKSLNSGISVIYIFAAPCVPCNKNLIFLKKLSKMLKDKKKIYGIVFGQYETARTILTAKKIKINLCVPHNKKAFIETFRIKHELDQLIVTKNRRIIFVGIGELSLKEYFKVKHILIKKKEK